MCQGCVPHFGVPAIVAIESHQSSVSLTTVAPALHVEPALAADGNQQCPVL